MLADEGTLVLTVTDPSGNAASATVKLTVNGDVPSIRLLLTEENVFGGADVTVNDSLLLIYGDTVASWTGGFSQVTAVEMSLNGKGILPGDSLKEAGQLMLTVANERGRTASATVTLTSDALYGLESLRSTTLQVDQPTNLLSGITMAKGVELVRVEAEADGASTTIDDPTRYVPEYPGTMSIIFAVKGRSGNAVGIKVENLTIKPLDYTAMDIDNINPEDLMPKVEV